MECDQSELGTSAPAVQPILIEPISSPAENPLQFESNAAGESRVKDAPSTDISSRGSLYQMVYVNVNGVVKNLMIPFQQAASDLQSVGANPERNTLEGNVSLSPTLNQVETAAVSRNVISNLLMTNTTSGNTFGNTLSPQCSEQNITAQKTVTKPSPPTSNTLSLQTMLGQPLQKICISNPVKEQLLHQTSGGKKVSFQLGPGKTLIFRSENGKLVGQLLQQPPQTVTRLVTVDKMGVTKRVVKISPPNSVTRNIRPINIVPSNTFAKPVSVRPCPLQKSVIKAVTPSKASSVPLSPKKQKIIILSHPPPSTEPATTDVTLPLPVSVPNTSQAYPATSTHLSVSSKKLCCIDSVTSLKGDHFVPVEPKSDGQNLKSPVSPSKETLRSLLKINNGTDLVNCVSISNSTRVSNPVKHCGKVSPSQQTSIGETSKPKKRKQCRTECEDDDWEPSLSEFALMQWSDADEKPVVRKIHDASVRPNYGHQSKGTSNTRTQIRPKRRFSVENITSCKMGCIGCKEHVKRVRKKKHRDIVEILRAKHPGLKKCSVVISRLKIESSTELPPSTKTPLAKKSTTKSGLYLKQSCSSTAGHYEEKCLFPCSDTDSVNSELEREIRFDCHSRSGVNQVDKVKVTSEERVSMDHQNSQDQGDKVEDHNLEDHNLSKSKYLMIKTNAGTFLVPTNSSQTPVVLNRDMLQTAKSSSDLVCAAENSCMQHTEKPNISVNVESEGDHSDVNSLNDFSFSESPKRDSKDGEEFDNTEDKLAVQFADEKPADRIQRLKECLKRQQQEMENARKLLESSRNVLRNIDGIKPFQ